MINYLKSILKKIRNLIIKIFNLLASINNYLKEIFLSIYLILNFNKIISLFTKFQNSVIYNNDYLRNQHFRFNFMLNFFQQIVLSKKKYDLVIAHDYDSMELAIKLKETKKVEKICFDLVEYPEPIERSLYSRERYEKQGRYLSDKFFNDVLFNLRYFDKVIYGHHKYKELFQNHTNIDSSVIFNSNKTNLELKKTNIEEYIKNFDRKNNIIIGIPNSINLTEKPIMFLEKILRSNFQNIYLLYIGNNFETTRGQIVKNKIYNFAKQKKILNRINFIPKMSHDRYLSILNCCHFIYIYCNPNYKNLKNLFSNRLFDSMSAKVPILVNDNCEIGKFVEDKKIGVTFNEQKDNNFEKQIIDLIKLQTDKDYLKKIDNLNNEFNFEDLCAKAFSDLHKDKILFITARLLNNRNKKIIHYLKNKRGLLVDVISAELYNSETSNFNNNLNIIKLNQTTWKNFLLKKID